MKLFNKALFLLGITAALVSCQALDQKALSSFEPEYVFADHALARAAVDGIYEAYVVTVAYRSDYMMYYGANTDVEFWISNGDDERSAICKYRILPTNSYLNNPASNYFYTAVFNSIERANLCIEGLREYGDVEHRPDMARLLGEAIVARALLYADAMNFYGEVPARFEPVTPETAYVPKADRDVLYKELLQSLEEAASLMSFDDQTTITRPGKACALGLYARLCLQAAGYARRPEEGKVNTGDIGSIRKSSDPELQLEVLYPKALAALEQIIDSKKFRLFDDFEDLWHYYCESKTSVDASGSEIIFGMPFSDNRGHHIVNNGVPNRKYDQQSTTGRKGVVPTLYFKYPSYDTRRDVTCCLVRWDENGDVEESNLKSEYCYFGKFRFDWMSHPLQAKDAEDGAKFTYLRYADILLMAAEIANELGDLPAAKDYMEPVLKRAYHDDAEVNIYLDGLTDHDSFFQAIKDQRALEFCGEMLRKADLIRWGCLKEALDQAKDDMTNLSALAGPFEGYRDAVYWRYKDPKNHNNVEVCFVKTSQDEPATAEGWKKKDKYLSTFSQKTIKNFYLEDPDQYMYRPIPASIITASLGSLKNDYGYTD